jgi:hypothetical protein
VGRSLVAAVQGKGERLRFTRAAVVILRRTTTSPRRTASSRMLDTRRLEALVKAVKA